MTDRLALSLFSPLRLRLLGLQVLAFAFAAGCAVSAPQAQTGSEPEVVDPPGRVGSLSLVAGPVELVDLDTGSRESAALNWPITGGWRLQTGQQGRAEVRIGSTALRLDDDTTVDFARLDDHYMQIAVLRGSVALRVRNRELLDEIEVLTQRERIVFDEVGRYRIDVDQVPGHTAVTAFAGRARIASGNNSFVVAVGQRGEISAPPLVRFQLVAATADRFDDWVAARDARDDSVRSASYVSREATGVELLDDYGDWRSVDDYGAVWFPRTVPVGWVPYRHGRWAWVDPWGWTWVDEAPWGFAPFHYGRWVVVGGVWGWVPGVIVPRPIYAPALVAWYGTPGISVTIGGPIGWFPLAPREVYVPAFRHSPRFLRVVNVQHVPNVERITIVQTPRYVHRHRDRSTWVPGDRFGRPDPVYRSQRPPPSEWRQYIARPQPPANVPNTKRRQQFETGTATPIVRPPAAAVEAGPVVRPPMTRAIEAPRAVEARPVERRAVEPRIIETPRAVDVPRGEPARPPVAQPREHRGRGELPATVEQRRYSPRAVPSAPITQTPQPVRPPEAAPAPAPGAQAPVHRGRGEIGAVPRNVQRHPVQPPVPVAPAVAPGHAAPERAQAPAPEPQRAPSAPRARPDDGDDRPSGRAPRERPR